MTEPLGPTPPFALPRGGRCRDGAGVVRDEVGDGYAAQRRRPIFEAVCGNFERVKVAPVRIADDQVSEKAKEAYAAVREFPELLDGLYCHCDCAERDGLRSLLSCFETKMPQSCGFCRGEAEMAGRLAREGKTLDEIRKAVDKRYA